MAESFDEIRPEQGRDSVSIPSPLLESILGGGDELYTDFTGYVRTLRRLQKDARRILEQENRIKRVTEGDSYSLDDIAGVDGTYYVKRTTAADVYVVASILLGAKVLDARSETYIMPPSELSTNISQGIMAMLETESVLREPSAGLTLCDGSFITQYIKIHSLYASYNSPLNSSKPVIDRSRIRSYMETFAHRKGQLDILAKKTVIALSKESASTSIVTDILEKTRGVSDYAVVDRVLLSGVLQPGEYVTDRLDAKASNLHKDELQEGLWLDYGNDIVDSLKNLQILYLKPAKWSAAQRIELSGDCSKAEIQKIARTVMKLYLSPTVLEPYPLFISDRICKCIGEPTEAIATAMMSRLAKETNPELTPTGEELQMMFRNYRSED